MMADEHLGHFRCLGTHKLNSIEKLCQHHFANGSIDQVQDYPYNMVNFGLLAAEILSLVWGTPANFTGFRVLTALLHGSGSGR